MCSYFTHFADDKAQEDAQRARQIRYYKECVIPAFPGRPEDRAAELPLLHRHGGAAAEGEAGGPDREFRADRQIRRAITETLKKVEAAGFDEVILYFNVGMKPHGQVKEEMDRFMREVAPTFSASVPRRRDRLTSRMIADQWVPVFGKIMRKTKALCRLARRRPHAV